MDRQPTIAPSAPPAPASASDPARVALEQLLSRDPAATARDAAERYDRVVNPLGLPVVLAGAGRQGRKTLRALRERGVSVLAFADNNPSARDATLDGLRVLSMADAAREFGGAAAFVVTIFIGTDAVVKQLRELGCRHAGPFHSLYWKYPDLLLPIYTFDLPQKVLGAADEVRRAYALLSDPPSRTEYVAQVRWRLDPDAPGAGDFPPRDTHDIYFPPGLFALSDHETFVDAGAFDGDSIAGFVRHTGGRFHLALAFEPDPYNFRELARRVAALPGPVARRVVARQLALGNRSETLRFDVRGAPSSAADASGELEVRADPLDALLGGEKPTFIKMDIEGAEPDALDGAAKAIRDHLPVLAISAYHRQGHLWELPLQIRRLSDRYTRMYLRRYTEVPYDDLVLYAIPER